MDVLEVVGDPPADEPLHDLSPFRLVSKTDLDLANGVVRGHLGGLDGEVVEAVPVVLAVDDVVGLQVPDCGRHFGEEVIRGQVGLQTLESGLEEPPVDDAGKKLHFGSDLGPAGVDDELQTPIFHTLNFGTVRFPGLPNDIFRSFEFLIFCSEKTFYEILRG